MSECLNKKALLEWLLTEANRYTVWGHEGTEAIRYVKWRIESYSDFDDDQTEVQRLREALGHIHAIAQSELDDLQYESQRKTWEEILLTAEEALSTTTEPTEEERIRNDIKDLLESWDFRAIATELESGYDRGVLVELVELCEKLTGAKSPRVNWLDQQDANAAKVERVREGDGNDA